MLPSTWFDVGSPSDLQYILLNEKKKVTFTSNGSDNGYGLVLNTKDTASYFWHKFSQRITNISGFENKNENIFPNPVIDELFIEYMADNSRFMIVMAL